MTVEALINRTYIGASIIFLALVLEPISISFEIQVLILLIGSLIVGLPHGALDYDVAKHLGMCLTTAQKIKFLLGYTGIAGINFLLWLILPFIGFLFFVAISIWHFGEDWPDKTLSAMRQLVFGTAFICLPALLHAYDLTILFSYIIPKNYSIVFVETCRFIGAGLLPLLMFFVVRDLVSKKIENAAIATLFIASGVVLPPLIYLFLYFCLYHGPHHTRQLYNVLGYRSFSQMFRTLLQIMGLTCVLLAGLFLFRDGLSNISRETFSSLIILIACLTTPHMMLIGFLNRTLNE